MNDQWISVGDRLPNKFKNVLACSKGGIIKITCVDGSGKLDEFELEVENGDYWTHWMPLPEPPYVRYKARKRSGSMGKIDCKREKK